MGVSIGSQYIYHRKYILKVHLGDSILYYLYVRIRNLWPSFGLMGSNKNVLDSLVNSLNIIAFTCLCLSLSWIHELVLENKAQFSCTRCGIFSDLGSLGVSGPCTFHLSCVT